MFKLLRSSRCGTIAGLILFSALIVAVASAGAGQTGPSGQVADAETGNIIKAATVRLTGTGKSASAPQGVVLASTSTTSDGNFSLNAGDARGVIEVSAPGYATRRLRWPGEVPRSIGLARGAKLTTRVTNQAGVPIPALVAFQIFHPGNMVAGGAESDLGAVEFSDLPSGPTTIVARSQGFAPAAARLDLVAGGMHAAPDFVLLPSGTLRGIVSDASGSAQPDALLVASYGRELPFGRALASLLSGRLRSAGDGTFEIRSIVPGASLTLHAEYEGRRSGPTTVTLAVGEKREGVVLVLE